VLREENKKQQKEETTVFKRKTQFNDSKKEKKDYLRTSKPRFMRMVATAVSALAPATAVLGLILFASACSTVDRNQTTLKEWQRTHLPTRLGRS
jgi:hypothetical protein